MAAQLTVSVSIASPLLPLLLWLHTTPLQDHMSLSELDVKNNSMIAISRVLGMSVEEEGDTEKNKQFVGDLLFGHGT
jgi:hypothetical protein